MWDCCCGVADQAPTVDISPEWCDDLAWISWWYPSLPWSAGLEMACTQVDDVSSLQQDAYVWVHRKGCHCTQCTCTHHWQVSLGHWRHTLFEEKHDIIDTSYLLTRQQDKHVWLCIMHTPLHFVIFWTDDLHTFHIWSHKCSCDVRYAPWMKKHWCFVSDIDNVLVHWTVTICNCNVPWHGSM